MSKPSQSVPKQETSIDEEQVAMWLISSGLVDKARIDLSKLCMSQQNKTMCEKTQIGLEDTTVALKLNVELGRAIAQSLLVSFLAETQAHAVKLPPMTLKAEKTNAAHDAPPASTQGSGKRPKNNSAC